MLEVALDPDSATSQLNRAFRAEFGVSPRVFRRASR